MEIEILNSIDRKLDVLIKLRALEFIQEKSKTESIIMLGGLGIDSNTIAEIVGTTPATVTARLWEKKKQKTTKPTKKQESGT